jgi:hypothetical protein
MDNQIFRVWDTQRNTLANIACEGDPNTMIMPPDCILQYQLPNGVWRVYRQATEAELRDARILARLDDIDALTEEIRQEMESDD